MLVIYTKDNCKYCEQSKKYLDYHDIKYTVINIDHSDVAKNFIKSNHTTVPQFYCDGKLLLENGYTGLMSENIEKLKSLIKK